MAGLQIVDDEAERGDVVTLRLVRRPLAHVEQEERIVLAENQAGMDPTTVGRIGLKPGAEYSFIELDRSIEVRERGQYCRAMSMHLHSRLALAALLSAAVMSGCGADEESSSAVTETTTATEPAATATPTPTATATPTPTATTRSQASGAPTEPLSREQAISVARRRYPGGRVREVERDDEDGQAVWKVKIRTAPSVEREVSVAVDGGRIVKTEAEEIDRSDDDVDD